MTVPLPVPRLRVCDVLDQAFHGLRARRARAALTSLGIGIGIAALVGVVGISQSSRADLIAQLDRLGTNLLEVSASQTVLGADAELPVDAPGMLRRVPAVDDAAAIRYVDVAARRNHLVPQTETGGVAVVAAESNLPTVVGAEPDSGRLLGPADEGLPAAVLGWRTAAYWGITDLASAPRVLIGDQWFSAVGILRPVGLVPDLDRSVWITNGAARTFFAASGNPSRVYVRAAPEEVDDVRLLLPATANPQAPHEVAVARSSDALAARAAVNTSFTALLLGLGAVALLVGGVGIANVMVIAVLERRQEIGVRRALGAARRHIRRQFLLEAVTLSAIGGLGGSLAGSLATAVYADMRDWRLALSPLAMTAGLASAVAVGALAGIYPAQRAASLAPVDAIRAS